MKFKTACLAASLAAAGLATTGLAQAQSKVELYGIVDVNIEAYNNAPDGPNGSQTVTGMKSGGQNASRWGLRGTEDIGNGLKVMFALETGFDITNGNNANSSKMFDRQAWAGIGGDWGTVSFGRQYTPSHLAIVRNTPHNAPTQYEPVPYISPIRGDNMIKYQGEFSGFSVGAYYGFSDQADQMADIADTTGRYGGAIGYNHEGMFRVMVAYDRIEDGNFLSTVPLPGNKAKADNWLFAARADFKPFHILGGYRHRKWEMSGQSDVKSDLWMIGAGYTHSPGTSVTVGYYHDKLKNAPVGTVPNAVRREDTWKQIGVFGQYALSRRTNLYATVAHAMDGALNLGVGGYALADGKSKQTGGAIGIRHLF